MIKLTKTEAEKYMSSPKLRRRIKRTKHNRWLKG